MDKSFYINSNYDSYKKSKEYTLKNGMNKYIKMFESVYEG